MLVLARFAAFNLFAIGLVAVAWLEGWIMEIWNGDPTHLSGIIALVFVCGWTVSLRRALMGRGSVTVARFADALIMLGLIGTVVGFIIALGGINSDTAGDISAVAPMVAQLILGMKVALYTTLTGSVLHLWLITNHQILDE